MVGGIIPRQRGKSQFAKMGRGKDKTYSILSVKVRMWGSCFFLDLGGRDMGGRRTGLRGKAGGRYIWEMYESEPSSDESKSESESRHSTAHLRAMPTTEPLGPPPANTPRQSPVHSRPNPRAPVYQEHSGGLPSAAAPHQPLPP